MGDTEKRLVPILLRGELANKSVLQVAAGGSHTMFVTADGLVFACGFNAMGQLGVGDTENRLVPTLVTGQLQGKTAVYAAAGEQHTLCITADGSLFAWCDNADGQLGVGDTESRRVPTLVTGLQGSKWCTSQLPNLTQSAPQQTALCSLGVVVAMDSWVLATISPISWCQHK